MDKALIIYTIFCAVVATPGYFMLLKKCNIPRWRAFIPLYRTYEIARVAGSEDAGIAWMLAYILVRLREFLMTGLLQGRLWDSALCWCFLS